MKKIFPLFVICSLIVSCVTAPPKPEKTQLQIREYQTRTYEISDPKLIMKAMLNVLQDDGFVVKNAVPELGLLSAIKEIDVENKTEAFWATFWAGYYATWNKNHHIEATCNVSEYGDYCKVRVSFQRKILDNKGGIREISQIEDEKFYQVFFSKVSKSIFIQRQKL